MTANPLPTSLYERLLPKLANILELTQNPEGATTPQAKQALLQATNDFKNSLIRAKELAANLPGGELSIEEQDEVIAMLEKVRDWRRQQLAQFSDLNLTSTASIGVDVKMEIDSMASTPFNE